MARDDGETGPPEWFAKSAGENSNGRYSAGQDGAGLDGAGQGSAGRNGAGQNSAGQDGELCRLRRALRDAILDRRFRPGQALGDSELAGLGASPQILREILNDLQREGLISTEHSRVAVTRATATEVTEIQEMRSALHSIIIRGFVGRASDSQLRALRRGVTELAGLADAGASPSALFQAQEWVYGLLLRGSGNASAIPLLARVRGLVAMVNATAFAKPAVADTIVRELWGVLHAIEQRDADRAVELFGRHLRTTTEAGLSGVV